YCDPHWRSFRSTNANYPSLPPSKRADEDSSGARTSPPRPEGVCPPEPVVKGSLPGLVPHDRRECVSLVPGCEGLYQDQSPTTGGRGGRYSRRSQEEAGVGSILAPMLKPVRWAPSSDSCQRRSARRPRARRVTSLGAVSDWKTTSTRWSSAVSDTSTSRS